MTEMPQQALHGKKNRLLINLPKQHADQSYNNQAHQWYDDCVMQTTHAIMPYVQGIHTLDRYITIVGTVGMQATMAGKTIWTSVAQ